jgi:hypothetical protein
MTETNLREELKSLHDQLEHAIHKEPLDKDVFGSVMNSIVKIAQGDSVRDEDGEHLKEQLEEQATDFEIRHPRLAATLRDIMDVLSKLGI